MSQVGSVAKAPPRRRRPSGRAGFAGASVCADRSSAFISTTTLVLKTNPSDGELIERIGAGDRSAFDLLYRRYSGAIFGLALRRLGDRGRAEDAVQDAFASVWRSASTYRAERGAGAHWLYAVARNAIVDRSRARGETPAEPVDQASGEIDPAERAESGWTAWRVHRAIAELAERERIVVELAYWGGLSQSEIADRLGLPLGTVKTRTRSALSRLADLLEEDLR
jgi:RNA polymerase sigma-70 factor, ECF subfamily